MSRAIDGDKLFEYIQKEKAWKQCTIKRPRYDKGKQDAYYEMLKIIQEQPTMQSESWIPVSERLPEIEDIYQVTIKYENFAGIHLTVRTATYENENWNVHGSQPVIINRKVIAWQPLPVPYKEVENEN